VPVDIIVTWGTPAAIAAKQATGTIPIVMGAIGDPVSVGLVSGLARPEGNITGFATLSVDLEGKRLELLKDLLPQLARVGILANAANPYSEAALKIVHRTAEQLRVAPRAGRGPKHRSDRGRPASAGPGYRSGEGRLV
jgi:putative tryptophan/tyrosine transport system substrate-binding protein